MLYLLICKPHGLVDWLICEKVFKMRNKLTN